MIIYHALAHSYKAVASYGASKHKKNKLQGNFFLGCKLTKPHATGKIQVCSKYKIK